MSGHRAKGEAVRFSISSISCVACTPAFRKGLARAEGIRAVKEFPMLNSVTVEFDSSLTDDATVRGEITRVAERAGFKGRVVFSERKRG